MTLEEQLKTVTKQRDAIMAMLEAECPPKEVLAYARSLSLGAASEGSAKPASGGTQNTTTDDFAPQGGGSNQDTRPD